MAGEAGCFIVVLAASDHEAQRDQEADDIQVVSIWSHLATSSHLSILLYQLNDNLKHCYLARAITIAMTESSAVEEFAIDPRVTLLAS